MQENEPNWQSNIRTSVDHHSVEVPNHTLGYWNHCKKQEYCWQRTCPQMLKVKEEGSGSCVARKFFFCFVLLLLFSFLFSIPHNLFPSRFTTWFNRSRNTSTPPSCEVLDFKQFTFLTELWWFLSLLFYQVHQDSKVIFMLLCVYKLTFTRLKLNSFTNSPLLVPPDY